MDEQKLIADYKRTDAKMDKLRKKCEYFMGLANEALKNDNPELAYSIIYRCPDHVTNCFIVDAVKQYKKKNNIE
jgi:hypothetical protein